MGEGSLPMTNQISHCLLFLMKYLTQKGPVSEVSTYANLNEGWTGQLSLETLEVNPMGKGFLLLMKNTPGQSLFFLMNPIC